MYLLPQVWWSNGFISFGIREISYLIKNYRPCWHACCYRSQRHSLDRHYRSAYTVCSEGKDKILLYAHIIFQNIYDPTKQHLLNEVVKNSSLAQDSVYIFIVTGLPKSTMKEKPTALELPFPVTTLVIIT